MGQTFRVEVHRDEPLSDAERLAVAAIIGEFGVEDQIERFGADPEALNWESFLWVDDPSEGVVLSGSTRLPDVTMSASFTGIDHWGRMLGRIRGDLFPNAEWDVHVEGEPVTWIGDEQRFGDPTVTPMDWDAFE